MSATLLPPLRVLFLGPLRDRVGSPHAEIAFPFDGTQAAFWKTLQEKLPALDLPAAKLRLARNNEFLETSELLCPGDELAIIPPVSGG